MTLADKIILERKKRGWSQEELADRMDVSRQAVSKWEAGQSTPDLDKILQLSRLFGVTTDYLLKDEVQHDDVQQEGQHSARDGKDVNCEEERPLRQISLAETDAYLEQQRRASVRIAIGVLLCIISPIPLLILIAAVDAGALRLSQALACGIGLGCIFLLVASAVVIFIRVGLKNSFQDLVQQPFSLDGGARELVQGRQAAFRELCITLNCIGAFLCILSPVPLICGALFGSALLTVLLLGVTMLTVAIGVLLFIIAGVRWASYQRLLQKGEYSAHGRKRAKISEAIETAFWLIVVAIYLGWSFLSGAWHITWVIWPVAGVLSAVVSVICNLVVGKSEDRDA